MPPWRRSNGRKDSAVATSVGGPSRADGTHRFLRMAMGPANPNAERSSSPSIAVALGGGGARGIAHIAILEALDELGIKPRAISGTSIGAIVGAAYVSGIEAAHLRAH